jgi:TRAP-type C4-dicarboxylate transport system permease small subunit
MVERYNTAIKKISKMFNTIGVTCIVINMLFIILNIVLRVVANRPMAGLVDYVGLLTTLIVGPTIAYCGAQGGHIEVEFILEKFPLKVQKVVYSTVSLISAIFLVVLTWFLGRHAYNAYRLGELPMTAKIKIYPFIYFIAIGIGLYALVSIGKFMQAISAGKEVSNK